MPPQAAPRFADVWRLVGLALLVLPCKFLVDLASFEVFTTEEAARRISREHRGSGLPENLQGVFWMAGNPAPELVMSLDAGTLDVAARTVTLAVGEKYSWSYNRNGWGFLEYFGITLSWSLFRAASLEFQFDEDWRSALLFLKVYGQTRQEWYFAQDDESGEVFVRGSIHRTRNGDVTRVPKYTALKVIDGLGRELPAFGRMVAAARNGTAVRDIPGIIHIDQAVADRPKTYVQFVNAAPGLPALVVAVAVLLWYGSCCFDCLKRSGYWSSACPYDKLPLAETPLRLAGTDGPAPPLRLP